MKIIGLRNGDGRELPQQVFLIADSAIIRNNKPFFVPHFAQRFTARVALALHIDRLGKHIEPRFAHRYCGAIAPAIKVDAQGINIPQLSEQHSALVHSFDGALMLGDFTTIDNCDDINSTTVSAFCNNNAVASGSIAAMGLDYREVISQLSTFFTLKMGDIILIELSSVEFDINIGDTLTATSVDNLSKLTIRVK